MKIPLYKRWWAMLALGSLVGALVFWVVDSQMHIPLPLFAEQRELKTPYHFISPLLSCGDLSQLSTGESQSLESELTTFITLKKQQGVITDASLYLRELNGGPIIAINSSLKFIPGSLLKVPLVLSVYKLTERDPAFFEKKVEYEGGIAVTEKYPPVVAIAPGTTYSVEDLIQATLRYSDNNAAILLTKLINEDELDAAYAQLGVEVPESGKDYTVDVKTYASFFRILFNATYLNHNISEHVLSTLAQATFAEGLVAGVPKGTVVAHKFGERSVGSSSVNQLHDCGIVYKSTNPYILCVMTRGQSFDELAGVIAELSKIAYAGTE